MVWYFQETPGDQWDYTSTQPMVLADLTINGRQRKVLLHAPKNGFFYVLDRITGEFISGDKYVKRLTWATGLDKNGRPMEAEGARFKDEPVLLSPGPGGAHNWQPMSFNPVNGLVYIPGQESSGIYTPDPNFTFRPGFRNMAVMGFGAPRPASAPRAPKEPVGAENQPKATGGF